LFKTLTLFDNWFEKIDIQKITFNRIKGSFKYTHGEDGFIKISSKEISLKTSLYFEDKLFIAKIDKLQDKKRKIDASGYIIFNTHDKIKLYSSLNLNINDDIKVKIYLDADRNKLRYKINQIANIKSIDHTMQMIDMPKEVRYWAYKAIKTSDIELKYAYGYLDFNNTADAIKNIKVLAIANNLQYTYNPKLEPVITKKTELEFRDGILFIRPKDAYQYGFYLNKSWLKIDFSKKEELLTLFLLFKGKVTKDLLYLLNTYQIKLPFLQNSGEVDTNLKIEVNLRTIAVNAKGDFFTKKSNFNYLGLDIDIFNARIFLDNYDVKIKHMLSKYKDIATAYVDVKFDAKQQEGFIDFDIKDINFKTVGIKLKHAKKPLKIRYTISKVQDNIDAEKSIWVYKGNNNISVSKMKILFDLKTLSAKVPLTYIDIDNKLGANIFGNIALKPIKLDLNLNLSKFDMDDIKILQKNTPFKIKYDKYLKINSDKKLNFKIKDLDYVLDKIDITLNKNIVNISDTNLDIKKTANLNFDAKYDIEKNNGSINIKKINIKDDDLGGIFYSQKNIELKLKSNKSTTVVESKQLGMKYIRKKDGWKFNCSSLNKIYHNSKLLRDNNISNGQLGIYQDDTTQDIKFILNTTYPYKFLVFDNKPITNYTIKGRFNKKNKSIFININQLMDIKIDKNIKITTNKIGINIDDILKYASEKKTDKKTNFTKSIFFKAKDSYLYISENRHAIFQDIDLTYTNKVINATLRYKNGKANFELDDNKIYLYGDGFNDEFMDNLFALSKFKGGILSFSLSGTTQEYDALIDIKETTIHDYKILNNILAFVNTVPSLMTFSVPGYNKYGLEVKNAYATIHSKDDIFYIDNFYMDSKELDILGRGTACFKTNQIDLDLNLKTDIGSSVSKIPLVGYILLGDDTVSTTMKITGKLDDPKIKSLIAKDIAVAPLNILKRTLKSPFQIFNKKNKK